MTLIATWGPTVSQVNDAGAFQDIQGLINFLTQGTSITGQYLNPNGFGARGNYNGTPISLFIAG